MGKVKRVLRCYNCGAILQSKKSKEPGFVPANLLESASGDEQVLYCQKCFDRMKLINSGVLEQNIDKETSKILDDAVATDALVVWVVDLFSFNGTLHPEIVKKVKKLKVVVVGTKRDLFSKSVKDQSLVDYITERFQEYGIKPYAVRLVGNEDEIDVSKMLEDANKARTGHDVYMIGSLTSGKTSLINKLLKFYKNPTKWPIKTEAYPGTNVKVLSIPITNSAFLYELPGLSLTTSVAGKVEKDVLKIITPKKKVDSQTKTLSTGDALVVGSLAYFELIKGKSTIVRFYSAERVETKKVSDKHIEDYFETNRKHRYTRPVSERFLTFKDYDLFEYVMENDGLRHDIAIEGLGWISFIAKGQTIRVMLPHGAALKESLSKVR